MRVSLIVASLVLGSVVVVGDSIYDGTGSLINADDTKTWGGNRDEADMQVHKGKNSTVTFQVLKNQMKCTHVDIHSDIDMGQDVIINLKKWDSHKVERSYQVKLPVGKFNEKDGISLELKHTWTTIAISSTKPINKVTPIYAYCRNSDDELNQNGLKELLPNMTKLENNHYHLGNGSIISSIGENGQNNFGRVHDLAITSDKYDAETSFQVLSSKDKCEEITLYNYNEVSEKLIPSDVENVLIKGWDSSKWKQYGSCDKLPCTINVYNTTPEYTLINIKTKAGRNNQLYAKCGKQVKVNFSLNEKDTKPKNLHSCKFVDLNHNWSDKYITALCSAGILEGYADSDYTEYRPNNSTLWQELAKVVNLSNNYYKTKKFRDEYKANHPYEEWQVPYLKLASKKGYAYNGSMEVTRGLAFQYVVDVFWNKKLSQSESADFLKSKKVITDTNINRYLTRAEMAKIALNSARYSGDENGIERKLSYTNHAGAKLNDDIKDVAPKSTFQKPKENDSDETINKIIERNKRIALKENITTNNTNENETNNKQLTNSIIGEVRDDLKNKSTPEIKKILEDENKLEDATADEKFDKGKVYYGKVKNSGEDITIPPADSNGKTIIEAKVQNADTGDYEKKIIKIDQTSLKKKVNITHKTDVENIIKKKASSND
jgi:hypothetical protein